MSAFPSSTDQEIARLPRATFSSVAVSPRESARAEPASYAFAVSHGHGKLA
jgi:hypothetical protein